MGTDGGRAPDEVCEEGAPVLPVLLALCQELAAGRYERVSELLDLTGDDAVAPDLQALTEAFGMMVVKLEAREMRLSQTIEDLQEAHRQLEVLHRQVQQENVVLRRQVEEMSIEIDRGRRDQEVSAIVETDYFKELQAKARSLRSRSGSGGGA